jgi:hypothetical protein
MSTQQHNPEEELRSENDFLKMKLMLERGAEFGSPDQLPAEIENQFLKNIIEFEEQWEQRKTIKIFEKIGRPDHFKPSNEIQDVDIEEAWGQLDKLLDENGIQLNACSPNVSKRELYRFTTEELFDHEMDDIDIPGMFHGFIYDEFHPDHEYENTKAAVDDCIAEILCKKSMEWTFHFRKENIRLNDLHLSDEEELKKVVNLFKEAYDEIRVVEITDHHCSINDKYCKVKGNYKIICRAQSDEIILEGYWLVEFELSEWDAWYIVNVQLPGIHF